MAALAFCSGCMRFQPVDRHWRALWIDSDGDLRISSPEMDCDLDFERPSTVFACGQTSALALTERYLHTRSFDIAQTHNPSPCTAPQETPHEPHPLH